MRSVHLFPRRSSWRSSGSDGGGSVGKAAADAVPPALQRPLHNARLDTFAVAASAAAAATTARAATIEGSAFFDNVDVFFCFLWFRSDFWSMQVNVGMTPKITPEVLH